jgi:hypothetical protein
MEKCRKGHLSTEQKKDRTNDNQTNFPWILHANWTMWLERKMDGRWISNVIDQKCDFWGIGHIGCFISSENASPSKPKPNIDSEVLNGTFHIIFSGLQKRIVVKKCMFLGKTEISLFHYQERFHQSGNDHRRCIWAKETFCFLWSIYDRIVFPKITWKADEKRAIFKWILLDQNGSKFNQTFFKGDPICARNKFIEKNRIDEGRFR